MPIDPHFLEAATAEGARAGQISDIQRDLRAAQRPRLVEATVTFAGTWQNFDLTDYGPWRLWRDGAGICASYGLLKTTTAVTNGSTILTVPAGFRPERNVFAPVYISDGTAKLATMTLFSTGVLTINSMLVGTFPTVAIASFSLVIPPYPAFG